MNQMSSSSRRSQQPVHQLPYPTPDLPHQHQQYRPAPIHPASTLAGPSPTMSLPPADPALSSYIRSFDLDNPSGANAHAQQLGGTSFNGQPYGREAWTHGQNSNGTRAYSNPQPIDTSLRRPAAYAGIASEPAFSHFGDHDSAYQSASWSEFGGGSFARTRSSADSTYLSPTSPSGLQGAYSYPHSESSADFTSVIGGSPASIDPKITYEGKEEDEDAECEDDDETSQVQWKPMRWDQQQFHVHAHDGPIQPLVNTTHMGASPRAGTRLDQYSIGMGSGRQRSATLVSPKTLEPPVRIGRVQSNAGRRGKPKSSVSKVTKSHCTRKPNPTKSRPFNCTFKFAGCDGTFSTKNEWKRHVYSQHLLLCFWQCDHASCRLSKKANFNRKDLFAQHLKRMHSPSTGHSGSGTFFSSDPSNSPLWASMTQDQRIEAKNQWGAQQRFNGKELPKILERCRVRHRQPPARSVCGFCGEAFEGVEQWDQRMEHVGRHYEDADSKGTRLPLWREDRALVEWSLAYGVVERGSSRTGYQLTTVGKELVMLEGS